MRDIKKASNRVLIDQVAMLVKPDVWFNRHEFAEMTSIKPDSAYQRLKQIVKDGHFITKHFAKEQKYLMPEAAIQAMINEGNENKRMIGRRLYDSYDMKALEIEAHHDYVWHIATVASFKFN